MSKRPTFEAFKAEALSDPDVRAEYDALEDDYQIKRRTISSLGSSLDDFLQEQGLYGCADQEATRRVLNHAREVLDGIEREHLIALERQHYYVEDLPDDIVAELDKGFQGEEKDDPTTTVSKTLADIESEPPISKERLAAIAAMPDQDINTEDMPELDDEFWKNATIRYPTNWKGWESYFDDLSPGSENFMSDQEKPEPED